MLVTLAWIENNYNKFNAELFGNRLPKIEFKISRSKKTWGYAEYRYNYYANTVTPIGITISNYYDSPEEVKQGTLIHEMVHILDYTINPRHFVSGGRKVRYDAHGYWFRQECERLKEYGWDIQKYVSAEEKSVSCLSARSAELESMKQDDALICVVCGTNRNFMFKTNVWHIEEAIKTVGVCSWINYIGSLKNIKVYKFNNPALASKRSCGKKLKGNYISHEYLNSKLSELNAVENNDYMTSVRATLLKNTLYGH